MASPYGNSAVYRGAQRRANMIQNRDVATTQANPLQDSIMGTPLNEAQVEPDKVEVPDQPAETKFTLKPYTDPIKRAPLGPRPTADAGTDLFSGGQSRNPLFASITKQADQGSAPPTAGGTQRMIRSISDRGMGQQGQMKDQRVPWQQFAGIGSIEDGYKQLLGREADPDGLAAMQGNPGGLRGALNTMYQSPEAQAYRQSLAPKAIPQGQQGQSQTPQYDSSNWNTEGWGTPQYLGQAAGGPMAGWDQTNWDDPNMQTPKYVVGRILSNYTPSMDGLGAAMEEIQAAYPGAEFDGKDKIIIPGLGTIDVLVNAGGDNMSWAWQDLTNSPGDAGQSTLQASLTGGAADPTSALLSGLDPSLLNDPTWRQLFEELGIKI